MKAKGARQGKCGECQKSKGQPCPTSWRPVTNSHHATWRENNDSGIWDLWGLHRAPRVYFFFFADLDSRKLLVNLMKPRNLGVFTRCGPFLLRSTLSTKLGTNSKGQRRGHGKDMRNEHLNGFLAIVLRLVKGCQAKGFVCILEIPEGDGLLRIPCCERRAT